MWMKITKRIIVLVSIGIIVLSGFTGVFIRENKMSIFHSSGKNMNMWNGNLTEENNGNYQNATHTELLKYYSNFSGEDSMGVSVISLSASLALSFELGVPINITASYPKEINPGQDFNVYVTYKGGRGYIHLYASLSGSVEIGYSLYHNSYDMGASFDRDIAYYDVVIGENKSGEIESIEIPIDNYLYDFYVGSISATISVKFYFNYLATTYLTGNVSLYGDALQHNVNQSINGVENTLTTKAIDNPWGYESAAIAMNNLNYHIKKFKMSLARIEFIGSVSGSGIAKNVQGEYGVDFDVSDLHIGTKGENMNRDDYGKFTYLRSNADPAIGEENSTTKQFGEISIATLGFPFSIMFMKLILPIIIATVVIIAVVLTIHRRRKMATKQELLSEITEASMTQKIPKKDKIEFVEVNSITVTCPHCGYSNTLPIEAAGKWVKCPKCGQTFQVNENHLENT